ncbi:MAG TPA: TolC family protein [Candidatus Elarobacter sp.]|nr:TolC family protein [Candidatus Elarobacter sp.]
MLGSRSVALALSASLLGTSLLSSAPAFAQVPPASPPSSPTTAPAAPGASAAPMLTPMPAPTAPAAAPGAPPGTPSQSMQSPGAIPQPSGAPAQPGTVQPGCPAPGTARPGSTPTQPGTTQPNTTQPGTTQPGATQPGTTTTTTPNGPVTPGTTTTTPGGTTPGAAAGQPGATARPPGGNIQGGGNPPPPIPAVLPPVPTLQGLSAPVNAIPNPDLVGVTQQPFVGLALQDAIAMALQRNTQLALSQSNRRIANYQIIAAKGAYDVNFQLVPSYEHSVAPVISPFNTNLKGGPVTTDTAGATAGFRGLTQQGGMYNAGVVATRVTDNSAYNSYNPFYETALQFSITQPLLRGRAIDQPRLQVQLAEINSSVASANALAQASATVVQVEDAYYDLASAWQNVAIQEEGLRNANAQAQSNARLAARGVVAPTDIVEANTQVNVFQDNVYAAIQNVQRVQTQLKQLLLSNPGDPVWLANLVPTTPVAQVPQEPALDALIASAIQNRPEVAQVRAQRQASDIDLSYAKDQLKPQLDLALGYTSNGFAGNPLPFSENPLFAILGTLLPPGALASFPGPPSYQTGKFGQSFQNALDNRFPTYDFKLTFSVPIGEHTGKADVAIAQEQQRQVQIDETTLVQRFRSEAVNAIQGLREAQYRVIAARSAREAAQRVLLGEQRRFQAGTSTTFLVLQRQLDVANQEGRELQAQTDLDKAIVELNRVSGGVFAQNGIDATSLGKSALDAAGPNSILPPIAPVPAPQVRRTP